MWKEFLDADTLRSRPRLAGGEGRSTARSTATGAPASPASPTPAATPTGPATTSRQANWYAFGRLAWNPDLAAAAIADEWIRDDVGPDDEVVRSTIRSLMLESRETLRGLHDAARPAPPDRRRPLRADAREPRPAPRGLVRHLLPSRRPDGIGFDRTRRGSGAVDQYRPPLRDRGTIRPRARRSCCSGSTACRGTTGCASGGTLWDGLVRHYSRGAEAARGDGPRWERLRGQGGRRALRGGAREAAAPGRRRRGVARQVPPLLPAVQRAELRRPARERRDDQQRPASCRSSRRSATASATPLRTSSSRRW